MWPTEARLKDAVRHVLTEEALRPRCAWPAPLPPPPELALGVWKRHGQRRRSRAAAAAVASAEGRRTEETPKAVLSLRKSAASSRNAIILSFEVLGGLQWVHDRRAARASSTDVDATNTAAPRVDRGLRTREEPSRGCPGLNGRVLDLIAQAGACADQDEAFRAKELRREAAKAWKASLLEQERRNLLAERNRTATVKQQQQQRRSAVVQRAVQRQRTIAAERDSVLRRFDAAFSNAERALRRAVAPRAFLSPPRGARRLSGAAGRRHDEKRIPVAAEVAETAAEDETARWASARATLAAQMMAEEAVQAALDRVEAAETGICKKRPTSAVNRTEPQSQQLRGASVPPRPATAARSRKKRPSTANRELSGQNGGSEANSQCAACGSATCKAAAVSVPASEVPGAGSVGFFCSWECAKLWNGVMSPLQMRHTRNTLIDIAAGRLIDIT